MKLFNLLNPEELIAGLEFSERAIRVALFSHDKRGAPSKLLESYEVELPTGMIVSGEIKNSEYVTRAVSAIMKRMKHRVRFVVATIPDDHIWSKVFSFPRSIKDEKLRQAMKVVVELQLPMPSDHVFVSWEELPASDITSTWLAAAPKDVISAYENVITKAGLKLIAVEFMSQSLARAVKTEAQEPILIMMQKLLTITFSIVKNGKVLFIKTTNWEKKSDKELRDEVHRVVLFSKGEAFTVDKAYEVNDLKARKELSAIPQLKKSGQLLAVFGAALRGRRDRDDDASISLLPVGTEEAYAFQRASTFAELLSSTAIAACIFFAVVYLAGWFFIISLQSSLVKTGAVANVTNTPESQNIAARASTFSNFLQSVSAIISETPARGPFLKKLLSFVPAGIIINEFNFGGPSEQIYFSGSAKSRRDLVQLRNNLQDSNLFKDVSLPPSNLELRADIPFSITLKILNPPILE